MKCNTLKSRFRLIDHSQLAGYKIFGLVCGESTRRARGCHYLPVREFQRLNQSIERRCFKSVSYIKKNFFGTIGPFVPPRKKRTCTPQHIIPITASELWRWCPVRHKHKTPQYGKMHAIYHPSIHKGTKQNEHSHSAWKRTHLQACVKHRQKDVRARARTHTSLLCDCRQWWQDKRFGALEETLDSWERDAVNSLTFVQSDDQSYDPQGCHGSVENNQILSFVCFSETTRSIPPECMNLTKSVFDSWE